MPAWGAESTVNPNACLVLAYRIKELVHFGVGEAVRSRMPRTMTPCVRIKLSVLLPSMLVGVNIALPARYEFERSDQAIAARLRTDGPGASLPLADRYRMMPA